MNTENPKSGLESFTLATKNSLKTLIVFQENKGGDYYVLESNKEELADTIGYLHDQFRMTAEQIDDADINSKGVVCAFFNKYFISALSVLFTFVPPE